jgi:hypothetical protein
VEGYIVIWREITRIANIGSGQRKLEAFPKKIWPGFQWPEELAMMVNCAAFVEYEISPRFRQMVEERVTRLERDAARDEANVIELDDVDHIRRQMRLVATQRAEALRMRIFLDRARTRAQRPALAQ